MPINKKSHQAPEMTQQSPECRQHYYAVMSRSVSASGTGTSEARQWQLWQLTMIWQGRWNMWPWPSQKMTKRLGLHFGFPVPLRQWLELERSYLAEWQMWGSRCSHCFLADLGLLLPLWHTFKLQKVTIIVMCWHLRPPNAIAFPT